MSVLLIRHGKTKGNLEGRYIGCKTDEPLCAEDIAALQGEAFPKVQRIFCSPMKRCVETAALLYPGITPTLVEDFREMDFGAFEGKSYAELNGNADYQAWIDSNGELPFPGGESKAAFCARCVRAYDALRSELSQGDCAIIAHGGTIMAIMENYAQPKGSYYDFQLKNGQGYRLEADGSYQKL